MRVLADLENFDISGVCDPCQRSEKLDKQQLIKDNGLDYEIDNIRQRVRCVCCGERTNKILISFNSRFGGYPG